MRAGTPISVRMSFDEATQHWIASASDPSELEARARTYPKARGRLRRALDKLHQRKVVLREHVELPEELQARVRTHQQQSQVWKELTQELREARMPLALELLELRLGLHDIANLLSVSTAQLGLLLDRELGERRRPSSDGANPQPGC
jgi:hypothetical protein